ncbi:MAG: histidine phosphatase family protein [Pseudomonadota bacterium]
MSGQLGITLVRHPEVTLDIKGTCYGVTDVALSQNGLASIPVIAAELCALQPATVYHSGLTRARLLAESIATAVGCSLRAEDRFREIDFGAWENRPWSEIFAEVGDDMARIIHEPDTFAPPGGETVHQLRDRVLSALGEVALDEHCIVVAHGGPISAVRGTLAELPASQWPGLVPGYGEAVQLSVNEIRQLGIEMPIHQQTC